ALPLTEVEASVGALRRSLLAAATAGMIVAALLGTLAAQVVARPLREMTGVARNLAAGRFGQRVYVRSRDEMGQLGTALNALSSDLERALGELTRERDLLEAVLNAMADGVLVTGTRGEILRCNPALLQ